MPQVKSLRWEQIDPRIAAQVGQTLVTTGSADASSIITITETKPSAAPETKTLPVAASDIGTSAVARTMARTQQVGHYTEGEQLEPIWTVFSAAVAFLIVCSYLSICFNLTGPIGTFLIALFPVAMVGACFVPAALTRNKDNVMPRPRVTLRGPIASGTLAGAEVTRVRGAFESAQLERAERLYSEVILHLAAPQTATREQVRLRRTLLRRCNALLADHFRIVRERQRVEQLLTRTDEGVSAATLEQVTQERDQLVARRDREADPIARASLDESVKLCEERLLSVQALGPTLTRLDAHDEAICQALSLAHAALTHADASPVAMQMPDVTSIRRALQQTGRDLRSMEAAVEELEAATRH